MSDGQFGVLSVVFWVILEANQKGIRSPAERVLVSLDGARSHILVKQSTVGFPFLPISHCRKCPKFESKAVGDRGGGQPMSDLEKEVPTDCPWEFGASHFKIRSLTCRKPRES